MFKTLREFSRIQHNLTKILNKSVSTLPLQPKPLQNFHCTKKQLKLFKAEYNSVVRVLCSSFNLTPTEVRNFHTALFSPRKTEPRDQSTDSKDNPDKRRTSDGASGSSNSDKNGGKKDDNENEKMKSILTKVFLWVFTVYMFITFASLFFKRPDRPETTTRYVSWNEFVHHMLAAGEVKELIIRPDMEMVTIILHDGAIIKGRQVASTIFHMAIADASKFEIKLRDVEKRLGIREGVSITYDRQSDITGRILVLLVLFALFMAFASRMKGMKSPISMDSFTQMGRAKFTLVDPLDGGRGVLFKDVAGLKEAKQEVVEFVDYLKCPEKYQTLGAKVPKGALLLGPPGCGKTLLAKAVATEAQVPFLSMNGSEFIEMIGGLGAARVRDLFKEANKRAPCIIYIDEIDAIGRARSGVGSGGGGGGGGGSGESEQTLNQLLVEMDGISSKEGVLMLASTNRGDVLDKALLRPGRFDRHILIDLPSLEERKEIFEKHLSGIQLEDDPNKYSGRLARLTPGFSGADIANVCNEAALHAARNSQKVVLTKNLEYAVERLVGGTEKRSHALSQVERKVIAYHESGHALVGWLLPNSDVLLKVTIVPRTSLALGFAQYTPSEQKLFTKEELFDKMCMALGGRAAENLMFSRITTGAQNDLEKVTKIAYAQIKKFGMNDVIGPMYVTDSDENDGGPSADKPFSKALDNLIDREARKLVTAAYENTEKVLQTNKDKLIKLAEALLEKETLNYDEVVNLIGPPLHEKAKRMIEPVEFEDSLKNLSGKTN